MDAQAQHSVRHAELSAVLSPEVRTLCRWLPHPVIPGAFGRKSDALHLAGVSTRLNLWDQGTWHVGDYVGPPRGGLFPGPQPNYDVALPTDGFVGVRRGRITGWQRRATAPIVRADGEAFSPDRDFPYFLADYQSLDTSALREHLVAIMRGRVAAGGHDQEPTMRDTDPREEMGRELAAIQALIADTRLQDSCDCPPMSHRSARSVHRPDTQLARLRRHSDELANGEGAPGQLKETFSVQLAKQAVRWFGADAVIQLPAWTLGWIFIAEPVITQVNERLNINLADLIHQADYVRLTRTHAPPHRHIDLANRTATKSVAVGDDFYRHSVQELAR